MNYPFTLKRKKTHKTHPSKKRKDIVCAFLNIEKRRIKEMLDRRYDMAFNYLKNCGVSPKHGRYLCPMRN